MTENQKAQSSEAPENAESNEMHEGNGAEPEIERLQAELKEAKDKYLYLYADFENYKKRVIKERSDLVKFGHESFARELLQVADNLDRALEHTANLDALVTGIRMVNQQLKDTLGKFGVTPIESVGQKFDPELHEAVAQEKVNPEQNGYEEGSVLQEHQRGYTLHGRLLRPARVVVATK